MPYTESMRLPFNEAKATQAAACLLRLRGNRMSYLKLIKLLYLLDREALLRWGRPVTTDRYVSMDNGPVVSRVYSLIRDEQPPGSSRIWRRFISPPEDWEVSLIADPGNDELSRAEESLIDEIFSAHGARGRWELVDLSHGLPEWRDPEGGAIPIEYRDILRAGRKTESEIASIEQDLEALAAVDSLMVTPD